LRSCFLLFHFAPLILSLSLSLSHQVLSLFHQQPPHLGALNRLLALFGLVCGLLLVNLLFTQLEIGLALRLGLQARLPLPCDGITPASDALLRQLL
jgi:hypothetical protein